MMDIALHHHQFLVLIPNLSPFTGKLLTPYFPLLIFKTCLVLLKVYIRRTMLLLLLKAKYLALCLIGQTLWCLFNHTSNGITFCHVPGKDARYSGLVHHVTEQIVGSIEKQPLLETPGEVLNSSW